MMDETKSTSDDLLALSTTIIAVADASANASIDASADASAVASAVASADALADASADALADADEPVEIVAVVRPEDLFMKPKESDNAIIICDASGSVASEYVKNTTIFSKFEQIIDGLPHTNFHILFWNSDRESNSSEFPRGIMKLPFIVTKKTLHACFEATRIKITNSCLTFPHLGFENISDWLKEKFSSTVYFLTDGEIGYGACNLYELAELKRKLAGAIKNLSDNYPDLQINIMSVENKVRNFNIVEGLKSAAGSDVYNVVHDNSLTGKIRLFKSYTPNYLNGHVHIDKIRAPAGCVPFKENYFSIMNLNLFIQYISEQIQALKQNEDGLIRLIQDLTTSLSSIIKDKPARYRSNILNLFCCMFNGTVIDSTIVNFLLTDSIAKESKGSADLYASYRANLNNLYKKADELLLQNVASALSIQSEFITFPLNNTILTGDSSTPFEIVSFGRQTYKSSAVKVDGKLVPIFPFGGFMNGMISEQCLRQWTRAIFSQMFSSVNVKSDDILYLVLQIILQTVLSPTVPDRVKEAYRLLGLVMFRKKRLNTNITELDNLRNGQPFVPNDGNIDPFNAGMYKVANKLGLTVKPMTMWYILCAGLGDKVVCRKQFYHCRADITTDFPELNADPDVGGDQALLATLSGQPIPVFTHYQLPTQLEYVCPVTCANTSDVGGYAFLPHNNINRMQCRPQQVLSISGYNRLLSNPATSLCPECFTNLGQKNFAMVGPKIESVRATIFSPECPDTFSASVQAFGQTFGQTFGQAFGYAPKYGDERKEPQMSKAASKSGPADGLTVKGTLVVLRGTVGSGKTTYAQKISDFCLVNNIHCITEGVDKYSQKGYDFKRAANTIKANILGLNKITDKQLVVVIDTSGEKHQLNNVFGVNFQTAGWTVIKHSPNFKEGVDNFEQYLSWSLRNVLQRKIHGPDTSYYLNPVSAGLATCIKVHTQKATSLFVKGKTKFPQLFLVAPVTSEQAIAYLTSAADVYAARLLEQPDEAFTTWKFV